MAGDGGRWREMATEIGDEHESVGVEPPQRRLREGGRERGGQRVEQRTGEVAATHKLQPWCMGLQLWCMGLQPECMGWQPGWQTECRRSADGVQMECRRSADGAAPAVEGAAGDEEDGVEDSQAAEHAGEGELREVLEQRERREHLVWGQGAAAQGERLGSRG